MGGVILQKKRFRALVVFESADYNRPWRLFTRRGWRHVWVLVPVQYPRVGLMSTTWAMKFEPTTWGVDVDLLYEHPENLARMAVKQGASAVVAVNVVTPPDRLYALRGLLNCVVFVKAVLGVRAWWVVSPLALFRYLVNNGGEILEFTDHGKTARQLARNEKTKESGHQS